MTVVVRRGRKGRGESHVDVVEDVKSEIEVDTDGDGDSAEDGSEERSDGSGIYGSWEAKSCGEGGRRVICEQCVRRWLEDELSTKKELLAADLEDRCGELGRLEA